MGSKSELKPPMPDGGWSVDIRRVEQAMILPATESNFVQNAGILEAGGQYVAEGALWRRYRPLTEEPTPAEPKEKLKGKWLWGGVLWMHFGHFLVESTGRLWPYHELEDEIEGIIFIPKRPRNKSKMVGFQTDFFDLLGIRKEIRIVSDPTEVEELIVPGQGFGLGEISNGTAPMRSMIHDHFAKDVAPDGPEKLYVSRTALRSHLGGVLGEARIEQKMRDEGYEVFYPEQHSLREQVAKYKAAKTILGLDGSAFHIAAMVGHKDQKIGMILRREDGAVGFLKMHVDSFTGVTSHKFDALLTEWVPEDKPKSNRLSYGEPDFAKLGQMLAEAGFISDSTSWVNLDEEERKTLWAESGLEYGKGYKEYFKYLRQRRRALRAEREAQKAAQGS
ncbi:glycosyltransferase family 61 protein [Aliiroseovarius crassostreae]|uniref:Glycosyltransferase family 61 protein n=1 Tax=Aliiroseovarius crassostreae TaxID=154981 RepID=A0A9Q9H9Q9_9RHOB|nr:glycosyltransferase family 61 protein [Aliiroseovarius crassostreae]UWP95316.1 glycosyltransferase family 61 protein [Aliiroseovarius crassostreae]